MQNLNACLSVDAFNSSNILLMPILNSVLRKGAGSWD